MALKRYFNILKEFDWILAGAVCVLICFGLVALYSIGVSFDNADFLNLKKQVIAAVIGLIIFFVLSFLDYRFLHSLGYQIYFLALALLVGVLFFGRTIAGTTGWFSLFGLSFQPVEVAKLALIIFLAWFLTEQAERIKELKTFLLSGLFVAALFLLVIFQPDFGSGLILLVIWFGLLFLSGANKKHLLAVLILMAILFSFAWFFLFADYQKDRILTFFNPQSDPYDRGYQVHQAVIAVGSGGLFGRGLGFGSQSQLKFIPASQTDFIFAVIAEELGFFGVSLVLFLWGVIFYRLLKAANQMKDNFSTLFIFGASLLFFVQIFVNIGMNIGLVPVTGIPLPLLSSGGSFLIVSLAIFGLAESMIIRNRS
ncbi:MAG: rod shape-determining protein RodA [Candidatus Buchananbacteria bacterium RIFCSPLOWO2_01_FULL_46_12]|uniref:Rod shape-determining protein RodA n=1 Tax=Candidatus Buchananbacteria bacterium RIFCSPLOWO2_01_FULL_46_12 TaxID=1797546 RepID=A0A1G1YN05_9BACT|nr:MAG: rod shape-determining protein RodA [Candidatus Buchananbacteria bacterium RIFCSPLOWO2_01_FULL_46_12]